MDLTGQQLADFMPFVPPQCFTKTAVAATKQVANPCYSCHTQGKAPNFLDDSALQLAYDFANPQRTAQKKNPWTNLFNDYSDAVAKVSDDSITRYVRQNNYRDSQGRITLAQRLADVPAGWDADHDSHWDGYTPDAYFHFDTAGYDHAPDGGYSGWRAFAYTPVPGSFIPANGSFDDVLIRLPTAFRRNDAGAFDIQIYTLNFAIVESLIKQADVAIDPVDEASYKVDLNRNGRLDVAHRVVYDWAPLDGRQMQWVGQARLNKAPLAAGLYPQGTEFIHSLRYLDVDETGQVTRAPRMKELRYARKQGWLSYSDLRQANFEVLKEAHDFPDRPERFVGNVEQGMANGQGWIYQGFIEDAGGELRPQTYGETASCMGCHGGVGTTTDSSFAFARKQASDAPDRGWYYWSKRAMATLAQPRLASGAGEYSTYLRQNLAGDEFRNNQGIIDRFFAADGSERPAAFSRLDTRIGPMILPDAKRALALDKAYQAIVKQQSFVFGRSAHVRPMQNVHRSVEAGAPTGIETPLVVEHATDID